MGEAATVLTTDEQPPWPTSLCILRPPKLDSRDEAFEWLGFDLGCWLGTVTHTNKNEEETRDALECLISDVDLIAGVAVEVAAGKAPTRTLRPADGDEVPNSMAMAARLVGAQLSHSTGDFERAFEWLAELVRDYVYELARRGEVA